MSYVNNLLLTSLRRVFKLLALLSKVINLLFISLSLLSNNKLNDINETKIDDVNDNALEDVFETKQDFDVVNPTLEPPQNIAQESPQITPLETPQNIRLKLRKRIQPNPPPSNSQDDSQDDSGEPYKQHELTAEDKENIKVAIAELSLIKSKTLEGEQKKKYHDLLSRYNIQYGMTLNNNKKILDRFRDAIK